MSPEPLETDPLKPEHMRMIQDLVYRESGIRLGDQKSVLISTRIGRRLRATGYDRLDQYLQWVNSPSGRSERAQLIDAMTTNETSFFRSPEHFDWFGQTFLPNCVSEQRLGKRDKKLKIWSAACSSGAEPYTLASLIQRAGIRLTGWAVDILGTDISRTSIESAISGRVTKRLAMTVPEEYRQRLFETRSAGDDLFRIRKEIRSAVRFDVRNLLRAIPDRDFDLIFLRNVLIYFDRESKQTVIDNLVRAMAPNAYLVVGQGEAINHVKHPLVRQSPFLFRKPDSDESISSSIGGIGQ